jgi:hypothetical protein
LRGQISLARTCAIGAYAALKCVDDFTHTSAHSLTSMPCRLNMLSSSVCALYIAYIAYIA